MRIPSGWFVTRRPFTGITDPKQRFVISSYRIPEAGFPAYGYGVSTYRPLSTGVVADVMELLPTTRDPVWKPLGALHLGRLGGMEIFTGQRWAELTFRLYKRDFYAFVWIGRQAPPELRREVLSILEGMTAK